MKKLILVLAVALTYSVSSAIAQDSDEAFKNFDADSDGKISKQEFMSVLEKREVETETAEKRFSKRDADGDGFISEEEMKAHKESKENKEKTKAEESG